MNQMFQMQFRFGRLSARFVGAMVVLQLASFAAHAQQVLFQGPAGRVSAMDVQADAATRISDAARATVLSRPDNVGQLASNLYVQRAMAAQALQKGLDASPQAKAELALAREKALTDLYWADFDQHHQPDEAALQAYARATYDAADPKVLAAPDRTRVRHILIKDKSAAGRAKAEALLEKLKAGASFEALARENSDDADTAGKGGDLGFIVADGVVPEFAQAMQALSKPGDLSGVVQSPYGYHIIELVEHRKEGKRPFDEMREQLLMQARTALLKEARAREVQRLLEGGQPEESAIEAFAKRYRPDAAAPKR